MAVHLSESKSTVPGRLAESEPPSGIPGPTTWGPGQVQMISYIKVYLGIYWYECFHTDLYWYIPVYTMHQYIPNRHGIYLYILYQRNDGFSIVGALLSGPIMHVYTSHVQ